MVKKTLNEKTVIFPPTQGATAAAATAAEEFSAEASPHPIAYRDEISRLGNPSLRQKHTIFLFALSSFESFALHIGP